MPLVSVIVPVYNVEYYLNECIDSILNQTFSDFEIILVDDGSTDGGGHICDEFAQKDERITVIHTDNCGVSSARNTGINNSSGKYIYFVDPDDYLDASLLEKCLKAMNEQKCDMIRIGYNKITDDGNNIYTKKLEDHLFNHKSINDKISFICDQLLTYKLPIQPWSFFISKDSILRNNLFFLDRKIVFSEDVCFSIMSALALDSSFSLAEPLYFFRKRIGSAMWDSKKKNTRNLNEYNNMSKLIFQSYNNVISEEQFVDIHHFLLMIRLKKVKKAQIKRSFNSLDDKTYFHRMNELYYLENKKDFCKKYGVYTGLKNKTFSKLLANQNFCSYELKTILLSIFIKPFYCIKNILRRRSNE